MGVVLIQWKTKAPMFHPPYRPSLDIQIAELNAGARLAGIPEYFVSLFEINHANNSNDSILNCF